MQIPERFGTVGWVIDIGNSDPGTIQKHLSNFRGVWIGSTSVCMHVCVCV